MSLITYIKDIIDSNQGITPEIEDDNEQSSKMTAAKEDPYTVKTDITVDQDKNQFVPKEMHWLNWENSNFRDALLDSQIHYESGGNPYAKSPAGAVGLTQFIPSTWEYAKKMGWIDQNAQRTDPAASLKAQKELMSSLYEKPEMKNSVTEEDRYAKTLAAYNAGYGSVQKAITKANMNGGHWLNYMSNETRKYVPLIMNKTEEEYFKNKENYVSKYKRD